MNPRNGDTTPDSHRGTLSPIVLPKPIETTVTIDADLLLEQAWAIEEQKLRQPAKELTWNEMRAELKAKGIKINRRWRMADVKAILDGKQDPT
jgi:hypothetical protein